MARYNGSIGFSTQNETAPGVWSTTIIEKQYKGAILQSTLRWTETPNLNDDININEKVSIIVDPYLLQNIGSVVYITIHGVKWKVSSYEVCRPRVIINTSGVYNG